MSAGEKWEGNGREREWKRCWLRTHTVEFLKSMPLDMDGYKWLLNKNICMKGCSRNPEIKPICSKIDRNIRHPLLQPLVENSPYWGTPTKLDYQVISLNAVLSTSVRVFCISGALTVSRICNVLAVSSFAIVRRGSMAGVLPSS
jgi:hypothetical protein